MPDAQRLDQLRLLREEAGLSQSDMARLCGLQGRQSHQTAGAWERGAMTPHTNRRVAFLHYLWDGARLRHDHARLAAIWEILVEEWLWEPISEGEWHRLTNAPRPGATASAVSTPALPVPWQAPPLTPHFVGREALVAQVTSQLTRTPAVRRVALVGMGGIGKTTLAVQLAHALRTHYRAGVLWAHAAISAPLDILNSWARAFGYDYSALRDVESCAATLRSVLIAQPLLFVLDDVTSVQAVRPLLLGGEQSALLLTTRNRDVAAALGCLTIDLTALAPVEGVQLLTWLVGNARVAQEPTAVTAISAAIYHVPLAVEIVGQLLAARPHRTLASIAQRLQDLHYRLDLQISDRAVRASFLVSWEALDAWQQRLFTHLALFAGRAFAAEALAAVLDEAVVQVSEGLDTLAARSLLTAEAAERYRQHPLLADFAREQLGEAPTVWLRFAETQLAFARRHQHDCARLEPEWDHLLTGMTAAHRLQAWVLVLDYAAVLTQPWFTQGRFDQARHGYALAVDAAQATNQPDAAALNLRRWGSVCIEQNDYATAGPLLEQAFTLALQVESDELIADVQWDQARIAVEQSNYGVAQPLLTSCRAIRSGLQDVIGVAAVDYWRALIGYREGALATAGTLCQQSLAAQTQQSDPLGRVRTLRLLTDIALAENNLVDARRHAQAAYTLATALQDQGEVGAALFTLCKIDRQLGDLAQAEASIRQSRPIFERIGSRTFLAFTYHEMGRIHAQRQEDSAGLEAAQQCVAILRTVGDEFNLVTALYYQGERHFALGESAAAYTCWHEARALAEKHHHALLAKIEEKLTTPRL